jgi:DNA adenine methylase
MDVFERAAAFLDGVAGRASLEKTIWGSPAGKKRLAARLVKMIPAHKTYVEPFVGSGAVFFEKEPADVEVLSDADPDIAFAYRALKSLSPGELESLRKKNWVGRDSTFRRLSKSQPAGKVDRLHKFLYTSHFAYGKLRGKSFNPGADGITATTMKRVEQFQPRLKNATMRQGHYAKVVKEFDGKDTFFFMDPPYLGHNVEVGEDQFDEDEFRDVLDGIKGRFLVTYGTRGKLDTTGFQVKKIRVPRTIRTMRGVGGPATLPQLLISNYSFAEKSLGDAGDGWAFDDVEGVLDLEPDVGTEIERARALVQVVSEVHPEPELLALAEELDQIEPAQPNTADAASELAALAGELAPELDGVPAVAKALAAAGPVLAAIAEASRPTSKAAWTRAFINDLPDSAFLHIEEGGRKDEGGKTVPRSLRHFPVRDAAGEIDLPHLRNALERIPQSNLPQKIREQLAVDARRLLEDGDRATKLKAPLDAEIQFARQMIPHHEAAIEMAEDLMAAGTRDRVLLPMARNIRRTQADEVKELQEWLRDHGAAEPRGDGSSLVPMTMSAEDDVAADLLKARLIPFQQWGGSAKYARRLADRLPEHKRYVEPFCGSAAVFYAKRPVEEEVLADASPDVVAAHKFIQKLDDESLAELRKFSWKVSRAGLDRARKMKPKTDAERFWKLAYGRLASYGAKPDLSGYSTVHEGSSYDLEDLWPFHERLKGAKVVRKDWRQTLKDHDGPGTLFFIDPPYVDEWAQGDGVPPEEIAEAVSKLKGDYIIAYTNSARARRALAGAGDAFTLKIPEGRGAGLWQKRARLFVASCPLEKAEGDAAPAIEISEHTREALAKRLSLLKTDEERFVLGVVLEPETVDAQKDIYSLAEVRQAAHKFMEEYQNAGLMHQMLVNDKVKIVESYLTLDALKVGDQSVKKGTWLLGMHVLDDALWREVKAGELTGLSIGGSALRDKATAA